MFKKNQDGAEDGKDQSAQLPVDIYRIQQRPDTKRSAPSARPARDRLQRTRKHEPFLCRSYSVSPQPAVCIRAGMPLRCGAAKWPPLPLRQEDCGGVTGCAQQTPGRDSIPGKKGSHGEGCARIGADNNEANAAGEKDKGRRST